jgi:hypothetical protein
MTLDLRLSRVRWGVAVMREDCNYQLDITENGVKQMCIHYVSCTCLKFNWKGVKCYLEGRSYSFIVLAGKPVCRPTLHRNEKESNFGVSTFKTMFLRISSENAMVMKVFIGFALEMSVFMYQS